MIHLVLGDANSFQSLPLKKICNWFYFTLIKVLYVNECNYSITGLSKGKGKSKEVSVIHLLITTGILNTCLQNL